MKIALINKNYYKSCDCYCHFDISNAGTELQRECVLFYRLKIKLVRWRCSVFKIYLFSVSFNKYYFS